LELPEKYRKVQELEQGQKRKLRGQSREIRKRDPCISWLSEKNTR